MMNTQRLGRVHLGVERQTIVTVREIAAKAGIDPAVVRFYTRFGLLQPARNPHNRYRTYTEADVKRLRFVHRAQSLGFTLKEIAQILEDSARKQAPCPSVRTIIVGRIEENGRRLNELSRLQERMERAALQWQTMPDAIPDGEVICHLIESEEEPS